MLAILSLLLRLAPLPSKPLAAGHFIADAVRQYQTRPRHGHGSVFGQHKSPPR